LLILFSVVMYRYTYGLNLPDLLAAAAVLLLLDSSRMKPPLMGWLMRLAAVIMVALSFYLYERLRSILGYWGWGLSYDATRVLWAQIAVVLAGMIAIDSWRLSSTLNQSGVVRSLRFPVVFGLINAGAIGWMMKMPPPTHYYFQKYNLHAVLLLAGAVV